MKELTKSHNHQVDPIVKTPVESGNEQGTAAHFGRSADRNIMKRMPPLLAGLSIIILIFAASICHAQGNITTVPIYKFVQGCFIALGIILLLGFIIALWNRFKLYQSGLWAILFVVIGLFSLYVMVSSSPGLIYTESDMTFKTMWPYLWKNK